MRSINQNIKPITTKRNEKGNLEIAGCDLVELAEKYGTPLYLMDLESLENITKDYIESFLRYEHFHPTFASKALMTGAIAQILNKAGFGFDTVSIGEMYTICNSGIDLSNATFNGNNKSREELQYALCNNISRISVDNFIELKNLDEIAKKMGKIQKIMLRITPGIECHTHEYIQTGHLDSKFGFDLTQIDEVINLILNNYKNVELVGLHAHIGSQIFETKVYEDEIEILIKEIKRIKDKFNLELTEINAGGGLGITYTKDDTPPSVREIADIIINAIEKNCKKYGVSKPHLYIEPGRSIVGTAGVTLYSVGSMKQVPNGTKYVALDGGMADNVRPSMYGAIYSVEVANCKETLTKETVTLGGKFCESGDILAKDIELEVLEEGDIVCFYNTGAYGYSMASNYNSSLKLPIVLAKNGKSDIIVKRQTLEQLVQNDVLLK